jgi:hypothetical protein
MTNDHTQEPPDGPPEARRPDTAHPPEESRVSRKRRFSKRQLVAGLLVLAAGAMFGAYRYFSADLPSTARLEMIEPTLKTQVFGADSSVVGEFFIEDRALVSLKDLPPYVPAAFVAVEDRKFYTHWGVDIFVIARPVLSNLRHGRGIQQAIGSFVPLQQSLDPVHVELRPAQQIVLGFPFYGYVWKGCAAVDHGQYQACEGRSRMLSPARQFRA